MSAPCALCPGGSEAGLVPIWQDDFLRVVFAGDPDIPAFIRVVCKAHVREMSDLPIAERSRMMRTVLVVEDALRQAVAPDKVNLASLGNVVPHLHWHVIPRYAADAHFPQPIWGPRQRDPDPALVARQQAALPALAQAISAKLESMRAG